MIICWLNFKLSNMIYLVTIYKLVVMDYYCFLSMIQDMQYLVSNLHQAKDCD